MTSGPNGEPLVVGIIYQDSRPANARLTTAVRKAVLLGHDSDSMPLLPVDRAGKSGRFISSVCPRGEYCSHVCFLSIESLQKSPWCKFLETFSSLMMFFFFFTIFPSQVWSATTRS